MKHTYRKRRKKIRKNCKKKSIPVYVLKNTASRTKQHQEAENTDKKTVGGKKETKRKMSKIKSKKEIESILKAVSVSAPKPIRGPCHTLWRILPTLVNSGVSISTAARCRARPSAQLKKKQTITQVL